jgi:hypothetical protein
VAIDDGTFVDEPLVAALLAEVLADTDVVGADPVDPALHAVNANPVVAATNASRTW